MKTSWIVIVVAVVVVFLGILSFNNIKSQGNAVTTAWANVESVYQTRYDKIPQLVEVIKGHMKYEAQTLDAVISARSNAMSVKITPEVLKDPEALKAFQETQNQYTQALSKLLMLKEAYPELKTYTQTAKLMDEIAGVENRLNVARQRYNEEVKLYNNAGMTFPGVLFAGMAGFEIKATFSATQGANLAPNIKF